MMYPVFILLTTLIILVLLTFLVIPSFLKIFQASSQKLPLLTKFVIAAALFIRFWWWALLLAGIAGGYALSRYLKTAEGKRLFDTVSLKIPLLNSFLRMMYLARFAENLSTLITGGLPIVYALEIVKDIMGNDVYMDIIQEAKEEVSKGNKISAVLQKYPDEFPPVFTQMVAVGETSGTLDTTLLDVVRFYQKELVNAVDSFLSILEPALIVILGAVVGGIVASIILPLYQIGGMG
ncbi:MAG: type II secretion system F family protein [Candidatus Wildermuthbacteria bacterium]|nr:type II secretion system F family protein [Candidatus Wildermuthbacteria bacterium]